MTQILESPLKKHPYAQAKVLTWLNGYTQLKSYSTIVLEVSTDGWINCTGLYSMTTRKHISAFVQEYLRPLTYHDIKQAYQHGYQINYLTGEIRRA